MKFYSLQFTVGSQKIANCELKTADSKNHRPISENKNSVVENEF